MAMRLNPQIDTGMNTERAVLPSPALRNFVRNRTDGHDFRTELMACAPNIVQEQEPSLGAGTSLLNRQFQLRDRRSVTTIYSGDRADPTSNASWDQSRS
jgi:hypothetical protein